MHSRMFPAPKMTNLCDKVIEMDAICYLEQRRSISNNSADKIIDGDGLHHDSPREFQPETAEMCSRSALVRGSFVRKSIDGQTKISR